MNPEYKIHCLTKDCCNDIIYFCRCEYHEKITNIGSCSEHLHKNILLHKNRLKDIMIVKRVPEGYVEMQNKILAQYKHWS
jgi:hypothetical protein